MSWDKLFKNPSESPIATFKKNEDKTHIKNCIWKPITDEQTVKVMENYELDMMNEPGARIGFKESDCVIKECENDADDTLIDDPVYRLECPPRDGRGPVIENITTIKRREKMARVNPYSYYNKTSRSPNSVVLGGKFTKKIKKRQRTVKRHKKRTRHGRHKPHHKLTHKYKNKNK